MSRRRHRTTERRLRAFRAPHEGLTQERAWRVVQTVYADRAVAPARWPRFPWGLAPAAVAIAGVLVLTPAGASVRLFIDQTLGVKHARAALFSLPAPGQILVAGQGGTWTIAADGTKHRLGPWREATWSPHARYAAVATRDQLTAVNLRGIPQWSVARPEIRWPRWFGPNGYRLAYVSGTTLRVIAGDGTADRRLATHVGPVAPAWQPGHDYVVAYAQANGTVVSRDADTGLVGWSHRTRVRPQLLAWSPNGKRLLVITPALALVIGAHGRQLARLPASGNSPILDGALSPDGHTLALLSDGEVTATDLSRPGARQRRLFTGAGLRQLVWSPDGDWLLVSWPAADQWIFIHVSGRPRIIAVSRIAEQFHAPGTRPGFPALQGWCCTATGDTG